MCRVVYTRSLKPRDARHVARLEREAYPRSGRAGEAQVRFDLENAEREGSNFSVGLYDGSRLAGYVLAYLCEDRAAAFEAFEVESARAATLNGPAIYVEDMVLRASHAGHAALLLGKWRREAEGRRPGLPVDAFCRPELVERWRKHETGFRRAGLTLAEVVRVVDTAHGEEWFWLSWRPAASRSSARQRARGRPGARIDGIPMSPDLEARLIQTESAWERLRPEWNRLAGEVPDASCFGTFDFSFTWWKHFGLSKLLLIVTLYRDGELIGIAPLMVAPQRYLGRFVRSLQFIGDNAAVERPQVLWAAREPLAPETLWRCVAALRSRWDAVLLHEQAGEWHSHPLARALGSTGHLIRQGNRRIAPYVRLEGAWNDYLARRSPGLRKALRRKLRRLEDNGEVRLSGPSEANAEQALDTYLQVEARSWKDPAGQGIAGRPGVLAYYRDLCRTLGRDGRIRFTFLRLNGVPIAATFGGFAAGRLSTLEICHDRGFDRYSPGFLLTGLELQAWHDRPECREYDFLSGTLENKAVWGTASRVTRDLYCFGDGLQARLVVLVLFRLKPAVKRLLAGCRLDGLARRLVARFVRPDLA